jgi:hypothetical protein
MIRRNVVVVGLFVAMLVASLLVLRAPDVSESIAFFNTGIPTMAGAEAVMALIAWFVIAVAVCAAVVGVVGDIRKTRLNRKTYPTASIFLAIGLLLFAFGALQRALPTSSICCGTGSANIREATQLAR